MRKIYPPGPHGIPVLGSVLEFMQHTLPFIQDVARGGDICHFRFGPKDAYLINRADYVYDVLVKNPESYYKDPITKTVGRKFVGNGLVLTDGEEHRKERKMLQPAFHYQRLQTYVQAMVEYTERMLDRWQDNEQINVEDEMLFVTLGIISKALLNTDVTDKTHIIAEAMSIFQNTVGVELRGALVIPDWLPIAHKNQMKKSIRTLDGIVGNILAEHQESGGDQGDFISMLMAAAENDEHMTNTQIRDETMMMFMAGHETTANLLTWATYLLAAHPDVQEKLHAEVDEVLVDGTLRLDDMPRLVYTSLILKEALRLYPPFWLTSRTPIVDVTLGDYTIRKGQLVFFSPYLLHHDARYFENPELFQPERFAGDFEKHLPRLCYFPFGAGPRVCIGQHFALMEATVVLAMMSWSHSFHWTSAKSPQIKALVTLRPNEPLYVLTTRRNRDTQLTASNTESILGRYSV